MEEQSRIGVVLRWQLLMRRLCLSSYILGRAVLASLSRQLRAMHSPVQEKSQSNKFSAANLCSEDMNGLSTLQFSVELENKVRTVCRLPPHVMCYALTCAGNLVCAR
eukprot:5337192-Amphidinium_carterae.3